MSAQIATRVDEQQNELFRQTTKQLGITPADALRVFVTAFNAHHGFPFDVRVPDDAIVEPLATEDDATDFVTGVSRRMLNEAW
jgi:DNA-damage-inducible protein J